jgi:hypothetical protein
MLSEIRDWPNPILIFFPRQNGLKISHFCLCLPPHHRHGYPPRSVRQGRKSPLTVRSRAWRGCFELAVKQRLTKL